MTTTMMMLIARFGAASSIPTGIVAHDYFKMSQKDFLKALKSGAIPRGNLDISQISRGGIPMTWLTDFIEMRRSLAAQARAS